MDFLDKNLLLSTSVIIITLNIYSSISITDFALFPHVITGIIDIISISLIAYSIKLIKKN